MEDEAGERTTITLLPSSADSSHGMRGVMTGGFNGEALTQQKAVSAGGGVGRNIAGEKSNRSGAATDVRPPELPPAAVRHSDDKKAANATTTTTTCRICTEPETSFRLRCGHNLMRQAVARGGDSQRAGVVPRSTDLCWPALWRGVSADKRARRWG